jgi:hypothetical protein
MSCFELGLTLTNHVSWGSYRWRPDVPVAQRPANAARGLAKLTKKGGPAPLPVVLDGCKIASTRQGPKENKAHM